MKDYEAVTLKAFLAALANQSAPLAADIQTKLNQIGANYEQHITDLDAIARQNPDLKEPYLTARKLLDSPQERNKGRASSPDPTIEKQNLENSPTENTILLRENTKLENLVQTLEKVNDQKLSEITPPILESPNSVTSAQDILPQFLDLYL